MNGACGETAFLSFCSNAFCEEGNRENDILTEKIGGTADHLPLLFDAEKMNDSLDLLFCSVGEQEEERATGI